MNVLQDKTWQVLHIAWMSMGNAPAGIWAQREADLEESWLPINLQGARLSRPLSQPEAVQSIAPTETEFILVPRHAEAVDELSLQTGKVAVFLAGLPRASQTGRYCVRLCRSLTLSPNLLDLKYSNDEGPVTTQVDCLYACVICVFPN